MILGQKDRIPGTNDPRSWKRSLSGLVRHLDGRTLKAARCTRRGAGFRNYSTKVAPVYNHSVAEFTSFFGALEVVPPSVADARHWLTRIGPEYLTRRDEYTIVGVASI